MESNPLADRITDQVLKSPKYHSLFRPTVYRIVEDILRRYPEKKAEKAVRRKLHQIWGAYLKRPKFARLQEQIKKGFGEGEEIESLITPVLSLQSSTRERIPLLDNFYRKIFSLTGKPKSIVEPACGFNALTYFWLDKRINYLGLDVDLELISFINSVFNLTRTKTAGVKLADLFVSPIPPAEIIFLLKVLTILEHQQKGCVLEVLRGMPSRFLVVSFPTRSLSGKPKGMINYYRRYFGNLVKNESWSVKEILFPSELVFVIKK